MKIVGKFEKVSYGQFAQGMAEHGFEEGAIRQAYDALTLPKRATRGSAGYDFKAPLAFDLATGKSIKIPTGIRVKIDDGWWLGCLPRSGLGFKYKLQLDNTMGVIDSDYYYSGNEGHIFVKLTNDNRKGKELSVKAGDGFMQAIFLLYGITHDDAADGVRDGGFGSTGR